AVHASAAVFLPLWAGQFVLMSLSNNLLGRGNNRFLMTEFFDLTKMFAFIQASMTLITGRRVRFQVTPKGAGVGEKRLQRIAPFGIVAIIYLLSIDVGLLRLTGLLLHTGHVSVQIAAVLWALALLLVLTLVTSYGYRKISARAADRVTVNLRGSYRQPGRSKLQPLILEDLTISGCAFACDEPPSAGEQVAINVAPTGKGKSRLSLKGTVRRVTKRNSDWVVGLEF